MNRPRKATARCLRREQAGLTAAETLLSMVVIMAIGMFLYILLFSVSPRSSAYKAADAQNNRQIALAGIVYGGDYDDRIPVTINGRWSRLQNRHDRELTINCPGPGTQDFRSTDAAGAKPTRTWVELFAPYMKARHIFINPKREDPHGYFATEPQSATDPGYNMNGATYRNQGRFPMYGLNYMFLAPIRIPKGKLRLSDAINYAEGSAKMFAGAANPEATVFFVDSVQSRDEPGRGFFVVNAPGMWPAFANNREGYVAFWGGESGGGDWNRDSDRCKEENRQCDPSTHWEGFAWTGFSDGTNATFLDGHVKFIRCNKLAAGTDYLTSKPASNGSGARIIDKKAYLWDYDGNFYGL